jgi:HK97 family phage major capsid protein
MSKLTKLLEYYTADDYDRKKMASSSSFKKSIEDVPKTRRELLLSDELEESHLLQEEVIKTIVEGAKDFRCMRDVFPIERTNTNSVRVVYEPDSPGIAVEVPEGGKIPVNHDTLSHKTVSIKKYGDRPLLSKEIIEDCLWNRVDLELKRLGYRMENALNNACMKEMLSSGVNTTGGTAGGIEPSDISDVKRAIKLDGFLATHMIMHPQAEGEFAKSDYLMKANFAGDSGLLREGKIGKLLGLKSFIYSYDNSDNNTNWGSTDGDGYIWVGNPSEFMKLIFRRDIQIEEYDDPIYDLVGLSATMRFGVKRIQNNAGYFITRDKD